MAEVKFFDEDDDGISTRTQDMLSCGHTVDRVENDEVAADEHDRECLGNVRQDFSGAISGFDLGIGQGEHPNFDPSILASGLDFGAGHKRMNRESMAEYLSRHGREEEAFERD